MKIFVDGKYCDKDEARVSVFDHGLLYGDGVFEGIRVYNGRAFLLDEHIDRLYKSARTIMLNMPMAESEMKGEVEAAIKINDCKNGYIRLIVTRGEGSFGLDPSNCPKPTVIIIVGGIQLYPAEHYERGIDVVSVATRRIGRGMLDARVKSLNYLNNVMAKLEAQQAGCMEAVMLNSEGYVAECTADNIFIVSNGALRTPPEWMDSLPGITMGLVLKLADGLGIRTERVPLTRYDLYTADEAFLTGTAAEIMPIKSIDRRLTGIAAPGPVTKGLMAAFRDYIKIA